MLELENTDLTISTPMEDIVSSIENETDIKNLESEIELFNLNLQKKNIIRTNQLSSVLDNVVKQMSDRFEHRADEFSNQDLLNFFKTVQDTVNKANTTIDDVKPTIQINQQVNVGGVEFDREARARILDAVNEILAQTNNGEIVCEDFDVVSESDE